MAEKSAESVCESAADCAASLANRTVWSRYLRVRGTSASYVGIDSEVGREGERNAQPICLLISARRLPQAVQPLALEGRLDEMQDVKEVVLVRSPFREPTAERQLARAGIDEWVEDVRLEVDARGGGGVGGGDREGEVEDRAGVVCGASSVASC